MPLSILADESVDFRIIEYLRNKNLNVISVLEKHKGIPDKDIEITPKKIRIRDLI
ncbi:MAG: hypothetical protein JW822_13295 [Spirochaetales bacterium]|nr:hypothetical protein [Spirochaetales bacterium]